MFAFEPSDTAKNRRSLASRSLLFR